MKCLRLALVALLCALPASSQAWWQSIQQVGVSAGGGGYTGPGDVTSFLAWGGMRAFSSATRGNRFANVCNSTGGIDIGCADMATDATTGQVVSATVFGITCPGANCTIKTLYDQTGNTNCGGVACDWAQASIANRPVFTASVIGSNPGMVFNGSSDILVSGTLGAASQPFSTSLVAKRTSTTTTNTVFDPAGGGVQVGFDTLNHVFTFASSAVVDTAGGTENVFHPIQTIWNGASSVVNIDGTSTTVSPGTSAAGGATTTIGASAGTTNTLTGIVLEVGIASGSFPSVTSLCHNQFSFYGTATSC